MSRRKPRPLPTLLRVRPTVVTAEDATPWTKKTYGPVHTRLVGQVEKHLAIRGDDNPSRFNDVVHPSDLASPHWCPRRTAYELLLVEPSNDPRVGGFRRRIFDDGKLIHRKWQQWLWEMGILYGQWRCIVCGGKFFATSPTHCIGIDCRSSHLEYREVPVESPSLRIYGRADGLVENVLIEVKGISPGTVRVYAPATYMKWLESLDGTHTDPLQDLWNQIKRPFPEHRRQGLIYCAIAEVPEILFIYEWKVNQQVKEFVVKRNDGLIQHILDQVEHMVGEVDDGKLPPRPKEYEPDAVPCVNCIYRSTCWLRSD